ncbi:MAG: FeoA family protein [Syntrophales bacterium]|nr:FeoA family protein [Syntrophales bacterium]MDD5640396.1 FeoA family protein [Syntrophales bacterium]
MIPLGLLAAGEKAEVAEIRMPNPVSSCCACKKKSGCCSLMEDLGLRSGKTVEILHNPGRSTILVKVDESRIALGRGAAMKIMVRRKD